MLLTMLPLRLKGSITWFLICSILFFCISSLLTPPLAVPIHIRPELSFAMTFISLLFRLFASTISCWKNLTLSFRRFRLMRPNFFVPTQMLDLSYCKRELILTPDKLLSIAWRTFLETSKLFVVEYSILWSPVLVPTHTFESKSTIILNTNKSVRSLCNIFFISNSEPSIKVILFNPFLVPINNPKSSWRIWVI